MCYYLIIYLIHAWVLSQVRLFATPWTVACQALSMGLPRQEYWSGFPFPPPGDLPDPGIKLVSPALAGEFFTTVPPGHVIIHLFVYLNELRKRVLFSSLLYLKHPIQCAQILLTQSRQTILIWWKNKCKFMFLKVNFLKVTPAPPSPTK